MIETKISLALAELNAAIVGYQPAMVVGLMSGGNDSLPACYIASLHPAFSGILHINTGIGIEDTRVFVRDLCAAKAWKLWEYKAMENTRADGTPDPMDYEKLVLKHGFPGAFGHQMMYSRLKERQLRRFKRDHGIHGRGKLKNRVMLVSGVRQQESARRARTVQKELLQIRPSELWAAPIRDWSKKDCRDARLYAGLPENPVAFNLHKSGECLCGAFAKKGELAELAFFYPKEAQRIKDLEVRAREAGHNWGWESQPPKKVKPPSRYPDDEFLCTKCNLQEHEHRETVITVVSHPKDYPHLLD
jgi:3'-phosphoadenosine 5'-phosphosulfate sulfotransferase (PAPS reductase)/FAD synthetase